jgi:hypothetical protein
LKLKCDMMLSTSAFKFNLRRYTLGRGHGGNQSKRVSHKQLSVVANTHSGVSLVRGLHTKNCSGVALGGGAWQRLTMDDEVGRCRLTVSEHVLKAPMVSALEATI